MIHSATARLITQPAPHQHCSEEFLWRTEEKNPGQVGQHLRTSPRPNRIAAQHPVAVLDKVPSPDRSSAEENGEDHRRPEEQPQAIEDLPIAVRPGIKLRHPQPRKRSHQTTGDQNPPSGAMPGASATTESGGKLEGTQEGIESDAHNV